MTFRPLIATNYSVLKPLQKESVSWSQTDRSILAISVYSGDGTIILLNEDGLQPIELSQKESDLIPLKSGVKVSCFQWNPNMLSLAVSWESGELGVYSIKNSKAVWNESNLKTYNRQKTVVCMQWLSDGLSLFTVDISGKIIMWEFDEMSNLLLEKHNHQISDQISDTLSVKLNQIQFVYFGSNSGSIYQMNESTGTISDVVALESGVKKLLYYSKRNRLIIITESMLLCQYSLSTTSSDVNEVSKVKLSTSGRNITSDIITAMMIDDSVGLIAICFSGERVVRLWQLESGNNAAVIVAESAESHWAGVTSVGYWTNLMAAGTSNNHIIIWKRSSGLEFNRVSQIQVKGSVKQLSISKNRQIACITSINDIYLITEQNMCFSYNKQIVVIQNGSKQVKVKNIDTNSTQELIVEIPVRNMYMGSDGKIFAIKLSGSKRVDFYRLNASNDVIDSYCSANIRETDNMFVIHNEIVWSCLIDNNQQNAKFSLLSYNLETNTEDSHQIDLLVNADNSIMQIKVIALDLNGDSFLVILSVNKKLFLYVFKLNTSKPILKSGPTGLNHYKKIIFAKINCDGTMIACVDHNLLTIISDNKIIKHNIDVNSEEEICGLLWADNESSMLCLSLQYVIDIYLCNVNEQVIKHYNQIEIDINLKLIALKVPIIYLLRSDEIVKQELPELEGLSEETVSVLLDFLMAKNIDINHLIKKVNQIGENNHKLWKNLAKLSVKSRDIDMGLYCISKLQNARVVRDVRQELQESGREVACALLAMNLGLHLDAEEILKECNNPLKLAKYYQNRNEWQKAIKSVDRVNQKTVYYNYAKHLEQNESNIKEAIKYYELSGTHVFEVPRMLFEIDSTGGSMLKDYCLSDKSNYTEKDSAYLIKWWGQYCESQGDINHALNAYEKAKDYYNLVRLLCYTGESEKAKNLINVLTNDSNSEETIPTLEAAMLHLGRHLESINPIESINYYLPSGAIKHAIRVCKTNNLINELIKLTITYGNQEEAKDIVNTYIDSNSDGFSEINDDYIVQIYYKCGQQDRAIEMALKTRTWTQLRNILSDLMSKLNLDHNIDININESIVNLALDALKTDSEIIDIVIDLLLLNKNSDPSLLEQLISDHNIEINEKLVDKVEKVIKNKGQTQQVMLSLADMALQQGNCLIAAKLYNNHGLRTNAIKALIRTGLTDKVISYANIARDKSVYKIAANYLKTIDFNEDSVIDNFLKKAGITNNKSETFD
ncbi:intraflagellar transport protein 140 homolog [Oppia nitens]|uniref:intraflagellar transport protein 140 homolog n=1 Tax=Oppia nitens TaxID=1686743 RepID=UPI0023DC8CA3|nr:intraflagellar transport protein 140 homolog [Oppia nitens]